MNSEGPPPPHTLERRRTPDHPPYAWMVRSAIQDLGENGGSTESSISSYIQSNYHSLPWGHSKLLPYYLNKLVIAGEISTTTTSTSSPIRYALPNPSPNAPLRRRGRPRKLTATPAPQNPNPNPQPQSALDCGERRESKKPRLIIKLKRQKDQILIGEQGQGEAFGGGWLCLRGEPHEYRESGPDQAAALPVQVESKEEEAAVMAMEEEEEENQEKKKTKSNKKPKRLWYER